MRKEVSDFWIGSFDSKDEYFNFFGENPDFYQDEDDIEEKYISKFAESQSENWIDHDFMESGFEDGNGTFIERFKKYSYSDQWITELSGKAKESDLKKINTIVFITKGRIKKPVSISTSEYSLQYIGQIEYYI
ncbi:MAG: immunity 22 family protein [Sporocytophaga sp.]|uniref:immunity 22 family protein n=1 Tax=Sporocytophaga sp. TaxID=2231183 RepID=UPI001B0ADC17|nr:immunity 22 family protein [Sporocytophaga sp.]MBO9700349.1 immunity 22 family protein [Sporocytophaga sp.]